MIQPNHIHYEEMEYYTYLVLFISFLPVCLTAIKKWKSKLPPGPFPLPIVGNLFNLGDALHRSLAQHAGVYGPLMTLQLGSVTTVIASNPKMAKEILQTHDQAFSNRTIPDCVRALDHHKQSMVWLPASTQWRNIRKICNTQLFITSKLIAKQGLRHQKVKDLLTYVEENRKNGRAVDIGQLAFSTILSLLSNTVFSKDLTSFESDYAQDFKLLVKNLSEESARPNMGDYFPVLRRFDLQGIRRNVEGIFGKLHDFFDVMIKERLEARKNGVTSSSSDFLDIMLDCTNDDGSHLTDAEIKSMLKDIFVAGLDTTSNTLEWAMSELIHSPPTMAKVKAELNEKIGEGNTIGESSIDRLSYLHAVVKETFRLHPPVPFLIPHKAESDVEISKFVVPKGAQVLVNLWAVGRDPTVWVNPELFNPDRFLDISVEFRGRHFELIPFGAGRRMCPGMPLAYRMLYLMLASLLHACDWKLEGGMKAEDMDMEESKGLTLQKANALKAVPFKS